jgi:hypothetical protein
MEDPSQVRIMEPRSVACSILSLIPTLSAGGEVSDKEGELDMLPIRNEALNLSRALDLRDMLCYALSIVFDCYSAFLPPMFSPSTSGISTPSC